MDCPHKQPDNFKLFTTTYLLERSEINTEQGTYNNFFNKDETPKSKTRHKVKEKYTLRYHKNKIKNKEIKRKFEEIRKYVKKKNTLRKD